MYVGVSTSVYVVGTGTPLELIPVAVTTVVSVSEPVHGTVGETGTTTAVSVVVMVLPLESVVS